MVKNNFLTGRRCRSHQSETHRPDNYKKLDENNGLAPYFRDVIRDELKKWCKEHKNPATGEPYNLYEDGLENLYDHQSAHADSMLKKRWPNTCPCLQKALSAQSSVRKGTVWKDHANVLEAAMKNSDRWQNLEDDGMSEADIRKIILISRFT